MLSTLFGTDHKNWRFRIRLYYPPRGKCAYLKSPFIRTWCDLHLWHVQFNVINRDTLLAAQKEPEKYRNLIVRIAGYSAYFVELSEDLQNDLIARTAHVAV